MGQIMMRVIFYMEGENNNCTIEGIDKEACETLRKALDSDARFIHIHIEEVERKTVSVPVAKIERVLFVETSL
jgi:hypothetical protein